jgi:hypothetical protein
MGLGVLGGSDICFKRKFRWMFYITNVVGEGVNMLPPDKGARPSLSFKEIEAQHLNETIYFAGKPDWKPIQITLFDVNTNQNPIFKWLKQQYDPCNDAGTWKRPRADPENGWKRDAKLEMYDGCGNVLEKWIIRNAWPNNVEWGDLDMGESAYVTVELTLRYDRAWIEGC